MQNTRNNIWRVSPEMLIAETYNSLYRRQLEPEKQNTHIRSTYKLEYGQVS